MLFRRSKESRHETYDSEKSYPAIRSSICTGEKVAGFRDRETGRFTEIMLLSSDKDLETFKARYGIEGDIEVFY
ncbi:MAG: hypothetical protein ILP16_00905 [Spirochaetales bacterium]|nr:hypothetical protein [Spirochaetales bacterium]